MPKAVAFLFAMLGLAGCQMSSVADIPRSSLDIADARSNLGLVAAAFGNACLGQTQTSAVARDASAAAGLAFTTNPAVSPLGPNIKFLEQATAARVLGARGLVSSLCLATIPTVQAAEEMRDLATSELRRNGYALRTDFRPSHDSRSRSWNTIVTRGNQSAIVVVRDSQPVVVRSGNITNITVSATEVGIAPMTGSR